MRLILDTNIFLEILLAQEQAEEAQTLLSKIAEHEFFLSDYSLHSIGLLLFRRKQHDVFRQFMTDMLSNVGIHVISLSTGDMEAVIRVAQRFTLDCDDAYQYVVAEKHNLILVSFDADFDRTERGRKTPSEVLNV